MTAAGIIINITTGIGLIMVVAFQTDKGKSNTARRPRVLKTLGTAGSATLVSTAAASVSPVRHLETKAVSTGKMFRQNTGVELLSPLPL
jgi:hypothetical protein